MKAIILNCSLKKSDTPSSTEAVANVMVSELNKYGVTTSVVRVAEINIKPGVASDEGEGDEWPELRQRILDSDIVIMASPTWVGRLSSMAQRVIERMDAMLSETDEGGRPVAYNRVAGFLATGNEDGAKHVIAEMAAALIEIGFTVPGQSWAYYNQGSPMGPAYIDNESEEDKSRTKSDVSLAAHNLAAVAEALNRQPIPAK